MTESLTWWGVQLALGFMDFLIMYLISHKMMKRYVSIEWTHVGLAVLYTLIVSPVMYFDGHLFRIMSVVSSLIAVKLIIKRAKLNDLIMIYVLSLLIIGMVQLPFAGGVWLINQAMDIYSSFSFLITQTISTVIAFLLCRKIHWYKWFNAVQSNYVLKLLVCLTALTILIPMAILNFEYNLSYFLLLTLGFVLSSFALVPLFIKLYRDTAVTISIKELKSSLFGMWLDMANEKDIEVFKGYFKATVSEFGVDLPTFSPTTNQTETKP